MARVIGNIPNFVNGVSQQPPAIRDPSQMQSQLNCYSTVARGLMPRPGTEHVAKLLSSVATTTWTHFINRDTLERYVVVYDDTASNTGYNKLTDSEMDLVTGGWANFNTGSAFAVEDETTISNGSPDGTTEYYAIQFPLADSGIYLYPDFAHAGNTTYTFSIWLRPPVASSDVKVIMQGADLVAPSTNNVGSFVGNEGWARYETSATTIASPVGTGNSNHFEIKVIGSGGNRIDAFCPMVSVGSSAPTQSLWGDSVLPRLRVYDIDGTEKQVWIPNGEAYLESGANPAANLKAVSVADYTFIANKNVRVAEGSTTSAAQAFEAYLVIEQVQPGSTVKLLVDGTLEADVSVSDSDPTQQGTGWMAEQLVADLTNAGTHSGDLSATFTNVDHLGGAGNVVYLKNATDFTVAVQGDGSEDSIRVVKKQVQTFGELPRLAATDSLMEVKGNANNDWSSFWVKYDGNSASTGVFTWSETVGPGETVDFDDTTMPHILVRNASDTFTFKEGLWADMEVGSSVTNAQPSFVGETIKDVFFTEGRLGFLAGENVVLSQASNDDLSVFNFWRTSVTSLLDGDPIDVSSTFSKVSVLRHAVPYQEQLLLFSDQTQFRLTKGDILSPRTVGIEPITNFECSQDATPAAVGNFVFFVVEKADYASVREYYVSTDTETNDAREISGHVPEYIPSGVQTIGGTSNEDLIALYSPSSLNSLWIYKYFWSGEQKVQGSWSEWQFPDAQYILGWEFFGSTMYMVLKRADGIFLEKLELDVGAQDEASLGYNLCMDRKVRSDDSSEVAVAYSAGTGKTTYTFSNITWKSVPVVVGVAGNSVNYPPGYEVTIDGDPSSYDANTIVLDGDTTSDDFIFGVTVPHSFQLSEWHIKATGAGNSRVPVTEGRLQVQRINFQFTDAGYFEVVVDQEGRASDKVYAYAGRNMSSEENVVNDVAVNSAEFSVPVMSKNTRASVTVRSNSPLPFRFISADWTGNFHAKGKRL